MKKLIMLLMAGLLITGIAYAQQDPEDPGRQDSLIIYCDTPHVDSTNTYQNRLIQIFARTDDSVYYYALPLKWTAPLGGISFGTGTLYYDPILHWDEHYDTVLTTEGFVRQFGFCNTREESDHAPLFTNYDRIHSWTLRLIIAPNTRSQWVRLDTCFDDRVGRVAFTNELGEIEITPGIMPCTLEVGHPEEQGINDDQTIIPDEYALLQNYPNPFNPETNIEFNLPREQDVSLSVYNLLGQQIRTLVNARVEAGRHVAHWDGQNEYGVAVPSGVYFYRLYTPEFSQTNKMILVR